VDAAKTASTNRATSRPRTRTVTGRTQSAGDQPEPATAGSGGVPEGLGSWRIASRDPNEKIAMASAGADRGHDARAVDVTELPSDFSLAAFDAVLVGPSTRVGKHQPAVSQFVRESSEAPASRPTGFFQVSLSSADSSGEAHTTGYLEASIGETGWRPGRTGLFRGRWATPSTGSSSVS
jgi:hypothetical protein